MSGATTAACCAVLALCLFLDALPVKYALPVAVVLTILSIRAKPLATTADAMRAFYYRHHGAIFLGEIGVDALPRPPPPGSNQLIVRVKAAALNPADATQNLATLRGSAPTGLPTSSCCSRRTLRRSNVSSSSDAPSTDAPDGL